MVGRSEQGSGLLGRKSMHNFLIYALIALVVSAPGAIVYLAARQGLKRLRDTVSEMSKK